MLFVFTVASVAGRRYKNQKAMEVDVDLGPPSPDMSVSTTVVPAFAGSSTSVPNFAASYQPPVVASSSDNDAIMDNELYNQTAHLKRDHETSQEGSQESLVRKTKAAHAPSSLQSALRAANDDEKSHVLLADDEQVWDPELANKGVEGLLEGFDDL